MRRGRDLKLLVAGMGATLLLLGLSPASASSANISHSYSSNGPIPSGSLVSLDPSKSNYVEVANTNNARQLLGVAVVSSDSLLAVDPTAGAVQVATSGTASALVSTLGGAIGVGDQVSVSPFSGIGMKATPGSQVIGLAQTGFNTHTTGSTTQEVTDKDGKSRQIAIGYVRLSIGVGTASSSASSAQLSALQKFSMSLTGRSVSTARIIISIVIALVALLSLITLVYASIYGGIISIGRNPLAKYAVFRSILAVLGMVIVIALISSTIIFLLLR